jgi:hypothetical protein
VGIYTHELLFEGLLVLHTPNTFQNPAKLSPTSLSEIQDSSAISLSWVERVTCVRALESFEKPSEHSTLEHLLISLKIFEASFTLGALGS